MIIHLRELITDQDGLDISKYRVNVEGDFPKTLTLYKEQDVLVRFVATSTTAEPRSIVSDLFTMAEHFGVFEKDTNLEKIHSLLIQKGGN